MRTDNLHARRSSERIGRKLGIGHWAIGAFFFIAALPQANGQTLSLTASDHNGYNISCFGGRDGSIDLTVTGGTPPYTYTWSHGPTTQDVSSLAAGYYSVDVVDANNNEVSAQITLTEPRVLTAELTSPEYGNGFNISLFGGYDGSIALEMDGGVAPYTYLWTDGPTTQNRTQLNSDAYRVRITDANSCELLSEALFLRQPDRSDWTMTGNAGTNPATHFFGTTDNKDVVFKSNGAERLRLKSGGDVRLQGLAATGGRILWVDSVGTLRRSDWPYDPENFAIPWWLGGNADVPPGLNTIGPLNDRGLSIITNGIRRAHFTTTGRFGIGTETPDDVLEIHHTELRGGIRLNNTRPDANAHSEVRFMKNGDTHWAIGNDFEGNGGRDFFLWDDVAISKRLVVDQNGKVGINMTPPANSTSIYRLYVDGGVVCNDVKVTAQPFPDYVFHKSYELMPLAELRKYLTEHKHLPHLPSEAEVKANEGFDVGDLQLRMVRTIEEQQLYILQLKQEVDELRKLVVQQRRVP